MRTWIIALATFLMIPVVSVDASDYWLNRLRDTLDLFSFTVGTGAGVKTQVGPTAFGLMVNHDKAGLRGGSFFWGTGDFFTEPRDMVTPIPNVNQYPLLFADDEFQGTFLQDDRNKSYRRVSEFPYAIVTRNVERDSGGISAFQIDVVIALGGSLRVGVNPAELLDFLLGWTTLDIADDDVGNVEDAQ